jgi:hypothetical protein
MIYDLRFTISEMPARKIKSAAVRQPGGADLPVCLLTLPVHIVKLAARQRRPTARRTVGWCCFKSSIINHQS